MLAILGLGNGELIIILVILLLMFGATKLPQLAKGLGKSVKEFKKASAKDGEDEDAEEDVPTEEVKPKKAAPKQLASKQRKELPPPKASEDEEDAEVAEGAREKRS